MTINRNDPKLNKYPGTCLDCRQRVEVGKGIIERNERGGWDTWHFNGCPLPVEVEVPVAKPEPSKPEPSKVTARVAVPDGIYTVIFEDESYKTLRLRTQEDDANFKPGEQVISLLVGSDNENDYTRVGHIEVFQDDKSIEPAYRPKVWRRHQGNTQLCEAVKVLFQDPKAAGLAYALQSSRCYRCNHTLTVPASVYAGLGPHCAAEAAKL